MLTKYITVFFISMVPLIELRGAIPFSQLQNLPVIPSYIVCIIGNMAPTPIIYLFARRFLLWGEKTKALGPLCRFCLVKGEAAGKRLSATAGRTVFVALMLFVGIPLPGTGAWTGTLAASILGMNFKQTTIAVICGVLLAGIIMMAASFGVFSMIGALLAR